MRIKAIAFLIAIGAPFLCQAQEAHVIEISPYWGYIFGGKTLEQVGLTEEVADHSTLGIRFDYGFTPSILGEIQVSRSDSQLLEINPNVTVETPFRTDYLLGYGKFLLSRGSLQPYVQIGAGIARLDTSFLIIGSNPPEATGRIHETRTRFTGSVTAGIDWFPVPHVGARIDARGYATDIHNDAIGQFCTYFQMTGSGLAEPVQCEGKKWLVNTEASAGVVFRF